MNNEMIKLISEQTGITEKELTNAINKGAGIYSYEDYIDNFHESEFENDDELMEEFCENFYNCKIGTQFMEDIYSVEVPVDEVYAPNRVVCGETTRAIWMNVR